MAGPFARRRKGGGDEPGPDAPTQALEPIDDQPTEATAAVEPAEADPPEPAAAPEAPAEAEATAEAAGPADETPGFVERGKLRRRLRYVRRAREVALRDLGGLVFDLHRFGRDRNDLVEQKLAALSTLDGEMRALEALLDDRRDVTVLREPGLASCPRCGALHASDAAFCSACGLPVGRGAAQPAGPALTGPLPGPAVAPSAPPAPAPEAPAPQPADEAAQADGAAEPERADQPTPSP